MRATDEEKEGVSSYLEWQLGKTSVRTVTIKHVEKVAAENIAGNYYEVWNCVTSQGKWWVVTPMMNLYTQRDFRSADVVLTFHVGFTARIISRDEVPIISDLVDETQEVWRKWEDAAEQLLHAQEAEDFQAIGMRLRESIVALLKFFADDDDLVSKNVDRPQDSNVEWLNLLAEKIAAGSSNSHLRSYLKNVGKETWQHVNWLTHSTSAQRFDAELAIANVSHLIAVFSVARLRFERGPTKRCVECGSYRISEGTCDRCGWLDESYVQPEPRPEVLPEELKRRLKEPHTLSSDIDTFISPEDYGR